MADSIDKGIPLMKPTFFDDNDLDNPKRKTYIERKEAIEFVRNNTPHFDGETTMQCVERSLANVPTADVVEVRHGEWEKIRYLEGCVNNYQHTCNACSKSYFDNNANFNYPYCPNCGAKMDGKGD